MKSRQSCAICAGVFTLVSSMFVEVGNAATVNPIDYKYIGHQVSGSLIGPFAPLSNGTVLFGEDSTIVESTSSNEARAVFEFSLSTIAAGSSVTLQLHNMGKPANIGSCFGYFQQCPAFTSFNVYGYTGDGIVSQSDYGKTTSLIGAKVSNPLAILHGQPFFLATD